MEYSQKYCAVQFLEPLADNETFSSEGWPLHSTLAGPFRLDWTDERRQAFRKLVATVPALTSHTTDDDYFGPNHDIHVMRVERTTELLGLHMGIFDFIQTHNGVFKELYYFGEQYAPHITMPDGATVLRNQAIYYSALSLVNMAPDGDDQKRCVVETISLK